MQTLRIDKEKNRLYVVLTGFIDAEEMKANSDETIELTKQLKPGFDVITDISNFKPTKPEATKKSNGARLISTRWESAVAFEWSERAP